MRALVVGDIHGNFSQVLEIAKRYPDIRVIISTGDLQIMRESDIDEIPDKYKHLGIGDFPAVYRKEIIISPYRWFSVLGNHENYDYLKEIREELYGLDLYIVDKGKLGTIVENGVNITGLSGAYSAKSFNMPVLLGKRQRHFNFNDINALIETKRNHDIDILLLHDVVGTYYKNKIEFSMEMLGLMRILSPRIIFIGHFHWFADFFINPKTRVIFMPQPDEGHGILDLDTWDFQYIKEK